MTRNLAVERMNDALLVRRIEAQTEEMFPAVDRRARPRCTHRYEDVMRMSDTPCPACSPDAYLASLLASAPYCNHEDDA